MAKGLTVHAFTGTDLGAEPLFNRAALLYYDDFLFFLQPQKFQGGKYPCGAGTYNKYVTFHKH
jgi:hypothetical protein